MKKRQKGSSLIELLLSATILFVILLPMTAMMTISIKMNQNNKDIAYSTKLAQKQLESYTNDFTLIPVNTIEIKPSNIDSSIPVNSDLDQRYIFRITVSTPDVDPRQVTIEGYRAKDGQKGRLLLRITGQIAQQDRFGQETQE